MFSPFSGLSQIVCINWSWGRAPFASIHLPGIYRRSLDYDLYLWAWYSNNLPGSDNINTEFCDINQRQI